MDASEQGWKSVAHDHEVEFPGQGRTALMRKHSILHLKEMPIGDPDCPKEVKLAKQIKCMIGNKAAAGDTQEEFNHEEVESGDSRRANPNPEPWDSPVCPEEQRVTGSTVTPFSSIIKKETAHRSATEEREAQKDEFTETRRLSLLFMQENAETKRQQRREESCVASNGFIPQLSGFKGWNQPDPGHTHEQGRWLSFLHHLGRSKQLF